MPPFPPRTKSVAPRGGAASGGLSSCLARLLISDVLVLTEQHRHELVRVGWRPDEDPMTCAPESKKREALSGREFSLLLFSGALIQFQFSKDGDARALVEQDKVRPPCGRVLRDMGPVDGPKEMSRDTNEILGEVLLEPERQATAGVDVSSYHAHQ